MSQDSNNSAPESQELREFFDSGQLKIREFEIRAQIMDSPNDATLFKLLAEVQRQQGHIDAAAKSLQSYLELMPDDSLAHFKQRLLASKPLPPRDTIPAKFMRLCNFLPDDHVDYILAHCQKHRHDFHKTQVQRPDGRKTYDSTDRQSEYCVHNGKMEKWFRNFFAEQIQAIIAQLRIQRFSAGLYSCKFNRYGTGHFFGLHQDRSEGLAMARKLGFVYYFNFPPKRFRGGELLLYDRDPDTLLPASQFTTIQPEHNSLILIPANVWHEVLPVACKDDTWEAARFTFSGWLLDEDLLEQT